MYYKALISVQCRMLVSECTLCTDWFTAPEAYRYRTDRGRLRQLACNIDKLVLSPGSWAVGRDGGHQWRLYSLS